MDKRTDFMTMIQPYVETANVKIIYSDEELAVLNFSDRVYVVSDYSKNHNNTFYGFVTHWSNIEQFVGNRVAFLTWVSRASKEYLNERIVLFNERSLDGAKQVYQGYLKEGPSEYFNEDFEKKLSEIKKSK